MKNTNKYDSFNEFWAGYVLEHASRISRAFHVSGVVLSALAAAVLVSTGMVFFLVLAVVPAIIGASLGHKLSPRHESDLAGERPEWAARADLRMAVLALSGRLGREIERVRAASVSAHDGLS